MRLVSTRPERAFAIKLIFMTCLAWREGSRAHTGHLDLPEWDGLMSCRRKELSGFLVTLILISC